MSQDMGVPPPPGGVLMPPPETQVAGQIHIHPLVYVGLEIGVILFLRFFFDWKERRAKKV